MDEQKVVKGFKVFNPDWTCRGFQYTCPGTFEEDATPSMCNRGFHFCVKAADCFKYYDFNPANKVAEVIALGDVDSDGIKSCTNKIQIVREITWAELLEIVNVGRGCSGCCNTGSFNSGSWNSGSYNAGDWNSGDWNIGDRNAGNFNSGSCNAGSYNTGNFNSGCWNTGSFNSGSWNKTSFSAGCFCTEKPKILLFNKRSNWTLTDWFESGAFHILNSMPYFDSVPEYVNFSNMTEQEKADHPEAETTGGYLKTQGNPKCNQIWWDGLSNCKKSIVKAIPNFDKAIFKEITGIDVDL